jgi:hypothetical protein
MPLGETDSARLRTMAATKTERALTFLLWWFNPSGSKFSSTFYSTVLYGFKMGSKGLHPMEKRSILRNSHSCKKLPLPFFLNPRYLHGLAWPDYLMIGNAMQCISLVAAAGMDSPMVWFLPVLFLPAGYQYWYLTSSLFLPCHAINLYTKSHASW